MSLFPCVTLRVNIVKSMSSPEGPRNGTDSAVPAERIRKRPWEPVGRWVTWVAERPQSTGITAGTSVGLMPAYELEEPARNDTVSRPSLSRGGRSTAVCEPTWDAAARHGASSAPGTCCPSTVRPSIVAVPCIASTRASGPPKLMVWSWQPVLQSGSEALAVERPCR